MLLANTALCSTQQSSERRWSNKKALLCRSTQSLEVLRRWIALPIDQQPFYEHQTASDERAILFLQATKVVRRRGPKSKIISVDVPHESFIGSILGGEYQLQRLRSQEDHLDVYTVTNRDGQLFEAQAFSFSSGISENLLHARKRRMKRILQSQNLIDEIEQAGKRFLISDVKRSEAEWKNLCSRNQQRGPALRSPESLTEEEFPDLTGSKCRKRSVSSDSAIQADGSSVCSSRPVSSLASHSSCSSYAEAAAKGLEHDRSSKTRKGVKQRQRRQRKRKGREIPCASPDSSTVKISFAESALALNRHSRTRRVSRRDHVG